MQLVLNPASDRHRRRNDYQLSSIHSWLALLFIRPGTFTPLTSAVAGHPFPPCRRAGLPAVHAGRPACTAALRGRPRQYHLAAMRQGHPTTRCCCCCCCCCSRLSAALQHLLCLPAPAVAAPLAASAVAWQTGPVPVPAAQLLLSAGSCAPAGTQRSACRMTGQGWPLELRVRWAACPRGHSGHGTSAGSPCSVRPAWHVLMRVCGSGRRSSGSGGPHTTRHPGPCNCITARHTQCRNWHVCIACAGRSTVLLWLQPERADG
jgi:hypothetical protein